MRVDDVMKTLAVDDVRPLVVAGGAESVVAHLHHREVVPVRPARVANAREPWRPIGLGPVRIEVAPGLHEEGRQPRVEKDPRRAIHRIAFGDSPESDSHVRFVEHHRVLRRVELHVRVAEVLAPLGHLGRRGRMCVEILVELPQSVQSFERDVERPSAHLARVERLPDDVERLPRHLNRLFPRRRVHARHFARRVPGGHQLLEALDLGRGRVEHLMHLRLVDSGRRERRVREVRPHRSALSGHPLGHERRRCIRGRGPARIAPRSPGAR